MVRTMGSVAICSILVCNMAKADETDIEKALTGAKLDFAQATEKAKNGLIAELKKKATAAQKAGDLKTLEKTEAELSAFEMMAELPKSIPTKLYEAELRRANAKLEEAYATAVKEFTKAGKRAVAKATQSELEEFKKGRPPVAIAPADVFKVGSVWVNDKARTGTTKGWEVVERKGDKFKIRTFGNPKFEQEISGTIKNGKLSYDSKDIRTTKGSASGTEFSVEGSIISDKESVTIELLWKGGGKDTSTATMGTLRLSKDK